MIEETVQVTRSKSTIRNPDDVLDLLRWALNRPGVYATASVRVDDTWVFEVGGTTIDSVPFTLGDTIIWDGQRFKMEPGT